MTEKIPCSDFEVLAVLYAADELEVGARAEVEEHARTCASCAAMLANEMRLREEIFPPEENAGRRDPQPDPLLLARCRHELAGALADAADGGAIFGLARLAVAGSLDRGIPARTGAASGMDGGGASVGRSLGRNGSGRTLSCRFAFHPRQTRDDGFRGAQPFRT